jgi:outer membrane murein-binding lipoprotein Lpp
MLSDKKHLHMVRLLAKIDQLSSTAKQLSRNKDARFDDRRQARHWVEYYQQIIGRIEWRLQDDSK